MAKMILKKNKEERLTLPVIKTYYKAIDIKELVQEWTNRPMEQNRGPEIYSHVSEYLIHDRGDINKERTDHSINNVG